MELLILVFGALCGFVIGLLIYRPKKRQQEFNEVQELKEQEELQALREILRKEVKTLEEEINDKKVLTVQLSAIIAGQQEKREALFQNIQDIELQAEQATKAFYEKSYLRMSNQMEQSAERLSNEFHTTKQEYEDEYLHLLEDFASNFQEEFAETKEKIASAKALLTDLSGKVTAAVEANKRAAQIVEQANYYKLNLSQEDLSEIKKLREIIPYLREPEALNKVIWKVYYEKPTTDLIGRVLGADRKTGIYKITSEVDQKCYVGQAVDVAARWKQHIKRGLGADTPTRNKLYPAMSLLGVENFTFEIIEECPAAQLDEREDFWQEYFHARDFGYSIK